MSEDYEIIIIGAGPAGSVAAQTAANYKIKTLLLEKEKLGEEGRYKACGGAMDQKLIDKISFPKELIDWSVKNLVLHYIGEKTFVKHGIGDVIWRSKFDKYLTDIAINKGVDFKDGEPLKSISKSEEKYIVKTTKGEYSAKYIIAADGVNSRTLHNLDFPKFSIDDLVLTITREIKLDKDKIKEILGEGNIHLYFSKKIIPMGYAWLFPKGDAVTVGWGNSLALIDNTNEEFNEFCNLPVVKSILTQGEEILVQPHLIPVGVRTEIFRDNVLAVGDAAGFVDPISGKGIPYAMKSGKIAVESIKNYLDCKEQRKLSEIYENAIRDDFLKVLLKKRKIRDKIFENKTSLIGFLELWMENRSSEIVANKLMK